jgi:hypothetical protein
MFSQGRIEARVLLWLLSPLSAGDGTHVVVGSGSSVWCCCRQY